jgi:hypothetical protein
MAWARAVVRLFTVVRTALGVIAAGLWRALTPIGRVVVGVVVVVAGLLSGLGRWAARFLWRGVCGLGVVLRGGWFALGRVVSALGRVGMALARAVVRVFTVVGRALGVIAVGLWRALTPIGRGVVAVVVVVAGLLSGLGRGAARFLWRGLCRLGVVFRGGWFAVGRVVSALGMVVTASARVLVRVLVRLLAAARTALRLVSAPFGRVWRAALRRARAFLRRGAAVMRLVARAALVVGRRSARVLSAAGRLAARTGGATSRTIGRLLRDLLRPVWRVAILAALAGRQLTLIGHRIQRVFSLGLHMVARVFAPWFRYIARLRKTFRNGFERMAEGFAALSRRTADGARVAAGTARHRANRLAISTSSADWRVTTDADGIPSARSEAEYDASFTLDVHENEYLRPAETTISAVISVRSEIHHEPSARPETVQVILLDCSASMGHPWEKIMNARRATQAAVAGLPDGAWFAIVRGAESADVAYPDRGGLVRASDRTRREAFRAISRLQPVGGTAIGRWLSLARELVALRPGALGHALLLTDGKDEDESPDDLRKALDECEGAFQCDCRGVGTDWAVDELRRVSTALLGTVDIIREPAGMEADFRSVIEHTMSRGIEVSIRIRTPVHAKVTAFRQVSPTVVDLTTHARRIDSQTIQFRLGGWADERRDYHLGVDVKPGPVGSEMAACRVAVVAADRTCSSGLVRAIWTDEPELTARIDPDVAHYTGQSELAAAVQEGLEAKRKGDVGTATLRLRRAVQLAASSGHADILSLLAKVVDVADGDTLKVSLRKDVEAYDEMALDTRSTRTVPARTAGAVTVGATAGPDLSG